MIVSLPKDIYHKYIPKSYKYNKPKRKLGLKTETTSAVNKIRKSIQICASCNIFQVILILNRKSVKSGKNQMIVGGLFQGRVVSI